MTEGYSIWKVNGGDVHVPKKIPRVGGLDNFPIPRVGSLIFLAIPVGGSMLGTPPTFYGVVKDQSTPTFLGVLPIIQCDGLADCCQVTMNTDEPCISAYAQ